MARFRGRYDFSIDQKGRINVPSKFRKLMSPEAEETFVICRGPGGCLWAFPEDEWEKFEDSLAKNTGGRDGDRFQRTMQNTLNDSTLDRQGRVSLTPLQMKIAGINKEVSIIGRGHYLEIWDTKRFDDYIGNGDDYDDVYYEATKSGAGPG